MVPCQRMKRAHCSALKPKNRSACLCLHLCPIHTRDASVGDSMTYKEKARVCVCVYLGAESLCLVMLATLFESSHSLLQHPSLQSLSQEPVFCLQALHWEQTVHTAHSFRAMLPSAYIQIYWHDILKSYWPFSDTRVMCALSRFSLRGVEPWSKHAVFSVWQAAISPAQPAGSSAFVIQRERQRTHQSITESLPSDLGCRQIFNLADISMSQRLFSLLKLFTQASLHYTWHVLLLTHLMQGSYYPNWVYSSF